eukprot:457688_1
MPVNSLDTLKDDGSEDELKIKYIRDNEKAFSAYTLALEGDQVFQLITAAITDDWPDGGAHLITDNLREFILRNPQYYDLLHYRFLSLSTIQSSLQILQRK